MPYGQFTALVIQSHPFYGQLDDHRVPYGFCDIRHAAVTAHLPLTGQTQCPHEHAPCGPDGKLAAIFDLKCGREPGLVI